VYLTGAYSAGTGFLFGWSRLAVVRPGDIALMTFVFARYAGQLILAALDRAGRWIRKTLVDAERKYPGMRPIGSCFPFTSTADDTFHILLELVPFGADWINGKPDRLMVLRSDPVKRLVQLVSTDRGQTFSVRTAIEPGTMFNMANLERPTGINIIPAGHTPPWIYFDGSANNGGKGGIRNNNVHGVGR